MASPLDPLAGRWTITATFPTDPPGSGGGWATFEWLGSWLVQRQEADDPVFPKGLSLLGEDPDGMLRQHYFDSRGVARLYDTRLEDGVWVLEREDREDFSQRYTGRFSDDGTRIDGAWEIGPTLAELEHDFELSYERVEA